VNSFFLCCGQRESKGRIVNVTSICGFLAFPGASAYCSSKFAFNAYTDCLRLEMASWGVKVCTLEPGFFLTAIVKSAAAAYDKRYRSLPAVRAKNLTCAQATTVVDA